MSAEPNTFRRDKLIRDWCDAANAYQRGDAGTVASALFPQLSDKETYIRTVGFAILAAALCGEQIRKHHQPSPLGIYGLQAWNDRTGEAIDPNSSTEAANMLTVGRLVTAAANRDYDMVKSIVFGHMPPGSDPERAMILEYLLVIYCAEDAS